MQILENYQKELQEILKLDDFSEYSFRTPLENLLKALKIENIKIIQEASSKDAQGVARADFKVYKLIDPKDKLSYNALVGFVECKNINVDLNKELKSEQLLRYLQICPNILLTNYRQFILLSFGKVVGACELFDSHFNTTLFSEEEGKNFLGLINDFYGEKHTSIKNKAELIGVLSSQSFYLSGVLKEAYEEEQELQENKSFLKFFNRTYNSFLAIQKYDFKIIDFCDLIAQSVVYGLFVAFIENENFEFNEDETQNFITHLPQNFKTLSEFVYLAIPIFDLPERVQQVLINIQKTIALLDKPTMAKFLNLELEQIVIYLYEDFVKAYDDLRATQKRKDGGIFYTPQPVVRCIVGVLDDLLRAHFGKKGFSEKGVRVLDFATGTGSFLASVCEKILEQQPYFSQNESFKKAVQNEAIKEKFLKEIYGFELSFVPYIVARLKLRQILKKRGYDRVNEADFQIYLNNTLDLSPWANHELTMPLIQMDEEWKKARDVKHDKNLLVILGNPPYNAKSKNKHEEILKLLENYKEGLNETNIQPLDNDYIKFMRFAQWKLLEQGQKGVLETNSGLMGFITPNSFLDGRIHRRMRQSLFKGFDAIYILNLHGSSEVDAKEDENVFDIKIGVCISFFVKFKEGQGRGAKVFYASTTKMQIFKRVEKFALLDEIAQKGLKAIKWEELSLNAPYFWFVPKSFENEEYEDFWALAEDKALGDERAVFKEVKSGINTLQDDIALQQKKSDLLEILKNFKQMNIENLRQKYNIEDSRDYHLENAKKSVERDKGLICSLLYRPFDYRYTYYDKTSKGFIAYPRYEIMQHLLKENLGICFPKSYKGGIFSHCFISNHILESGLFYRNRAYVTPLYLYEKKGKKEFKNPNFTPEFLAYKAKHKILKDKSPEEILAFIYASLYSLKYREKYLEYLKIGFPRVNFEVGQKEFERFEKLGSKLISLHLMQEIPQDEIDFEGELECFIEKRQESERFKEDVDKKGRIILNKNLSITGISREVWDYTIGGYAVLKQWLKYRKDYTCTMEELEHLLKICKILRKTLQIQKELDES